MKQETIVRLDKIMEKISDAHVYIFVTVCVFIASPFIIIYYLYNYIDRKVRRKVYDQKYKEWITPKEKALRELREKWQNREVPLVIENHATPDKNDQFLFFEKRKLFIPCDQLVYVESEYSEKMHRFFDENAEWLDTWQKWHGWDIAEYSYEDIKEGMLYPQDFAIFKHGFLWCSPFSTSDKEADIFGTVHYYYEIDPDSETPIKEQMELFIRKVYEKIDLF